MTGEDISRRIYIPASDGSQRESDSILADKIKFFIYKKSQFKDRKMIFDKKISAERETIKIGKRDKERIENSIENFKITSHWFFNRLCQTFIAIFLL